MKYKLYILTILFIPAVHLYLLDYIHEALLFFIGGLVATYVEINFDKKAVRDFLYKLF